VFRSWHEGSQVSSQSFFFTLANSEVQQGEYGRLPVNSGKVLEI